MKWENNEMKCVLACPTSIPSHSEHTLYFSEQLRALAVKAINHLVDFVSHFIVLVK